MKKKRNIKVEIEVNEIGEDEQKSWEESPMSDSEATKFRAIVARCNFLSIDRPDILYASKECSRCMSTPLNGDWAAMKRLGRYLLHKPKIVHMFRWQDKPIS